MSNPISDLLREVASQKCGLGSDRIVDKDLLEKAAAAHDEMVKALEKAVMGIRMAQVPGAQDLIKDLTDAITKAKKPV